jgi:hypothetical protein
MYLSLYQCVMYHVSLSLEELSALQFVGRMKGIFALSYLEG